MAARRSGLGGSRLRDLYGLHHGGFQAPTERARLKAAVHQVFGGQPWGGCCSDKFLELLLDAGERCCLKQQLYWDFQLLDSDHDGYLSTRDAELLLRQVPRAQATGEAWLQFLRSHRPGVAWRDIEDWLFGAPQLPPDGDGSPSRRIDCHGQGAGSLRSSPLPVWGVRRQTDSLLEGWDPRRLATLLGEEPSGVVAALEQKYWVLRRKLCAEMLQMHYGQPAWASLLQNEKEDKLSELEVLVDFGLREGSMLPLSSLPGALHRIRSETQTSKGDPAVGTHDLLAMEEGTAAHALQRLQCKKQEEMASLMAQRRLLVGSPLETSKRLLHLHAQTELVQKEASFPAALLVLELLVGERFWDSRPVDPETCHRELAQLRLAAGHDPKAAWQETETVPGRSMAHVLLDRLLLQQERDRATLVHLLLALKDLEITRNKRPQQETAEHSGNSALQVTPTGGPRDMSTPSLQEVVSQMLTQKRLQVAAQRAELSWQEGAVAVLMDLQREQQQELTQAVQDLTRITSGGGGEACPALYESLLARLQDPPLMPLLRRQQCWGSASQQEAQQAGETLQGEQKVFPSQETSPYEGETSVWQKPVEKEGMPCFPQEEGKNEAPGVLEMVSETFPDLQKQQEELEGMGLRQSRKPEGPDGQPTVKWEAEKNNLSETRQTEAKMSERQKQKDRMMLQTQGFPEPVPEELKREMEVVGFEGMRDAQTFDTHRQRILEDPPRQGDVQEQPKGLLLVPGSEWQHETKVTFTEGQRGAQMEPETPGLQEKMSAHQQGPSEMKGPKACRIGEVADSQDSAMWQEPSQRATLMEEEDLQAQKVSGSPGHLQRKLPRETKSLTTLEFALRQDLWPQGLRQPEISLHPYEGIPSPHLPAPQNRERGVLEPQAHSVPRTEKEAVQADEMVAVDLKVQHSLKEKQELLEAPTEAHPPVFILHDGIEKETRYHLEPQEPLPKEWREPEATQHPMERETLQGHKDLQEKSLTSRTSEVASSQPPCHLPPKIPGLPQFHGLLLKKSKSLGHQDLSQTKVKEPRGSPQIQQEGVYSQSFHPQEPREASMQESSQAQEDNPKGHRWKDHPQEFPRRGQELVQSPTPLQKEPEVSVEKEGQDFGAPEAQARERDAPCPQAQEKTEVTLGLRDAGETQEHLGRYLERQQVHPQRKPGAISSHPGLAREAKSLTLEESPRTQGAKQRGNFLPPEMLQGLPLDATQAGCDWPQGMLQEAPEAHTAPHICKVLRASGREQETPEPCRDEGLRRQGPKGPEGFPFDSSELLQGDEKECVSQETGSLRGLYRPEEKFPEATRDQRDPELPQPQDLPLYGTLWRKSKSLELRRPPDIGSQGLQAPSPQPQGSPSIDAIPRAPQGHKPAEDSTFESQRLEETGPTRHKSLQVQAVEQQEGRSRGLPNLEEVHTVLSKGRQEGEAHKSQEPPSPDVMESPECHPHEGKGPEMSYVHETAPETQAGTPQKVQQAETPPPLLWTILGQKAKSFELGKRGVLLSPESELGLWQERPKKEEGAPQEVKEASLVQLQDKPQVGPGTQTPQEPRESKVLSYQGNNEAEKAIQIEKLPQELKASGTDVDAVGEPSDISTLGETQRLPSHLETRQPGTLALPLAPLRKPPMPQNPQFPQREVMPTSHLGTSLQGELKKPWLSERKTLENLQTQDTVPQKVRLVHQPEEVRSPEFPPLLWAASGMKSKSFELTKPHASEAQDLGRSQMGRSQKKLRSNIEVKDPCGSQDPDAISSREVRDNDASQVRAEKERLEEKKALSTDYQVAVTWKEIPQPQESGTLKHPVLQEKQSLLDEEKNDSRRPQDQGTPQSNLPETPHKGAEWPRDPEDVYLEPGVPQTHQPNRKECHETGQTQGNGSPSQMVLCHKESRMSETPPLLWGILEAKAKSFELQKPKVFQTQNMRHMEPTFLAQSVLPKGPQVPQIHGLQGLQMALPQGEPRMEPRAPETLTDGGPEIFGPADQREQEAHLGQTEGGSPHMLKSSGSQEESGPQVPLKQRHLLQDSEVAPGLHPQKLGGLETHKAQTQRSPETSQSNIIPQQGLEEPPQASHPHKEKTSGSSQPQPPDETQSEFPRHPERNSPETPPLLWWALELAQQRMLHDEWLVPSQPQEETPGTQRQVGPEMVPKATKALMDGRFQDTGEAQVQAGAFQDKGAKSNGVLLCSKDMRGPKSPQPQQQGYKAGSVGSRLSISQPCESQALKIMEATQSLKTEVSETQSWRSVTPPPIQKSTQVERDLQDLERSPREQRAFLLEKPKDFKSSLLLGERSGRWDSKERDHPRGQVSPQTREKPDIPCLPFPSLQTQEMLKCEREDDGPSCDSQVLGLKEMPLEKVESTERVKLDGCTASETQESPDKAKDLLPPGKLTRKSKSLDLRKVRDSPSQGACQPQARKEKKRAVQVPDGFQMERQTPHVPEASTSVQTSGLEIIQARSTTHLLQAQGEEVENQTSPRSILGVKSDSLEQMEPGVTQTQELSGAVVLQPRGSPQSHPGNLALQGPMDPKTLCPQGHCEGGNCNSGAEDKPSEMGWLLERCPQTFHVQITAEPQIALLGRSKSLEPHEGSAVLLQGPKNLETPQDSGGVKIGPRGLENQAVESCRDNPPRCEATTETVNTLLQVPRNEVPFTAEHGKHDLEGSAPQKRENRLDLLENIPLEIQTLQGLESIEVLRSPRAPQINDALVQSPGIGQTNIESYGTQEPTDPRSKGALECQEIPMKGPAGLEFPVEHPLPCLGAKALEFWWILGKSKSLDSGESHVLQSKPSGRNEDPLELQNIRKLDIRLLRDEFRAPQGIKAPVLFHSTMLPPQEPPQEDSQNQDERGCDAQRPHQRESEPTEVQEPLRNEGRDLCSQKHEDVKFTKGEGLEGRPLKVEEAPPMEGCMEGEQDLQGLEEKQLLGSPEKRDTQSPALPNQPIRKSKTVGFEWPTRSDVCQIQCVPRPESPEGQIAPTVDTQWLHETVGPGAPSLKQRCKMDDVLQPHEMLNVSEGTQGSLEPLGPRRLAHKMEDETLETEKSLHDSQDSLQEQKGKPPAPLQDSGSQVLAPHGVSQFGPQLLQQLGQLHNELGILRPQELKDEELPRPQETGDVTDREESTATNVLLTPQDREWRGMESDQFSLGQNDSEALREELQKQLVLQSLQKAQGPLKASGVATRESNGSTRLSVLKGPGVVQLLEHLPETSPLVPEAMGPPVFPSQESTLLKDFCFQESPQVGWEPLKDEGRMTEGEPGPPGSQEELEVAWSANSRYLEPQELSKTAHPVQHQVLKGAVESVHSWEKELNVQQGPAVHGPLQRQTPTLGSQETPSKRNHLGIHPPHNQRELKVHPVEKQLAGEQETSHLTELWPINLDQRQWEIQTEMGTPGPGLEAESPASEELREAGTWSNEGAIWGNLLTPGVSPLNLEYPEPGAINSGLQASPPPWEKEATEIWKPTTVTMLSPPSPGSQVEDAQWERASFRMGLSREASICIAQGGRLSRLSQENVWREGQGATEEEEEKEEEEEEEEEEEAKTWQSNKEVGGLPGNSHRDRGGEPPPPHPPCREKAFVWSSRQEKEDAVRRLAELQAEGERRQRRDKERQILRSYWNVEPARAGKSKRQNEAKREFQERLSIAKRRKSEDDLVGGSPSERWLFSAAHPGQDQARQKTAVKHQLEKVKRERTYIMQSKRERNSLRFKELLSLHVAPREESPDPGQLDDL